MTLQDLSLGSLPSFSTPAKYRIPSTSSGTTAPSSNALSTPSPGASLTQSRTDGTLASTTSKRLAFSKLTNDEDEEERDAEVPRTPGEVKGELMATPMPSRLSTKQKSGSGAKGATNLTLRDQEKHIDALKKENFNIKLKVHFLEERLAQLAPDQIDAALKQNINLKIEVQQRGVEMKKYKKLVLELERELQRLQQGRGRERELEQKLENMEHDLREVRRRKGGIGPMDEELREENEELKNQVVELRAQIEENYAEMQELAAELERKGGAEATAADMSQRRSRLEARIRELEDENEDLHVKLDDHAERSESQLRMYENQEEREAMEDTNNELRDKLAAAEIELNMKDDELTSKDREIQEIIRENERAADELNKEWRQEVDEARNQVEELRDVRPVPFSYVLAERDADSKELRMHVSELEANTTDLHNKFEAALAHLEQEAEEKDAEIESANREIQKLGQRVFELEDELDNVKAMSDKIRDEEAMERDRLDTMVSALKEEELAQHVENLVEEMHRERELRQKVEFELDTQANSHDAALRSERRTLEAKESALQSALADLARTQALLTQRDADLEDVQAVLREQEAEVRKRGENATADRFSLQLEVDRLRRDADRLEEELSRARAELAAKETKMRERDDAVDRLHAENRDLTTQLASQTQARLNMIEKLDASQNSLRTAESELASCKQRLSDLEQRLSKDQRSLLNSEKNYTEQLHERNSLLLTIYSYMDKILGVEKMPPETKPFTNFPVFHELIMTRLKALNQIATDFEKRSKEIETRYTDKLNEIRKQIDSKWKQIDKFDVSVRNLMDQKHLWKRKLALKEGELEALKSTNSELQTQVSSRRHGQSESLEIKSLQARAANAERRLTNAQNQLLAAEEKMAAMNQKTTVADNKWEARVKEYESRLRAAEERVKRERQGAKERVNELETTIKSYRRQIDIASKRNQQLNELVDPNKASSPKQ
ncbi:uncharacterized protein FOMMEDRAFT_78216 [Fomitiporia mediterranea MF3/22]|uniref:uncharacterized protein n=1 Tax=Fomitiporia mediterranea (strain MF3/22) TaxID=694068 RepID=UPI000440891E|nr:uncharacterized protein FOMMEDRAFT_78216 [Fomitiporia mediterranea MF3/22]EJD06171.1 hypothetical protein FOMMEDRAFT_78216 [Fomitiporia mediterranea MF3/22]